MKALGIVPSGASQFLLLGEGALQIVADTGAIKASEVVANATDHTTREGTACRVGATVDVKGDGLTWTPVEFPGLTLAADERVVAVGGSDEHLLVAVRKSAEACAPRTEWYRPGACTSSTG